MIEAYLISADGTKWLIDQPSDTLEIHGDRMELADGSVATHVRHAWDIGGEKFILTKINSPVRMELRSDTGTQERGPFAELWVLDGMVLSGLTDEFYIVRFNFEAKLWIGSDWLVWKDVIFRRV